MNSFEKSSIIGYWRSGASWYEIALIMGISESYAKMIVREYITANGIKFIANE